MVTMTVNRRLAKIALTSLVLTMVQIAASASVPVIPMPGFVDHVPRSAGRIQWPTDETVVFGVVQLLDSVGRNQVHELDRLSARSDSGLQVGILSIDRMNDSWPKTTVTNTREKIGTDLPVYEIDRSSRRLLFSRQGNTSFLTLPQVVIVNQAKPYLKTLIGFQTAEEIEEWVEIADRDDTSPPVPSLPFVETNMIANGSLDAWTDDSPIPADWNIWDTSEETFLKWDGSGTKVCCSAEISSGSLAHIQVLYQRINIEDEKATGKKCILSALIKGNTLSRPVVGVAGFTESTEFSRKVPQNPYASGLGQGLPMYVLGACDPRMDTTEWQEIQSEFNLPAGARVLTLVVYIEDPEPYSRAIFDNIQLLLVD